MKSRISIALDEDNQPIIKIDYAHSDDVRDDMVKRFMQHFGGDSSWAQFQFLPSMEANAAAKIRPIPVKDLEEHSKLITAQLGYLKR